MPRTGMGRLRDPENTIVYVLAVHYEWRNNALATLHNFHEKPVTVSLDLKGKAGERLINLYSTDYSQAGPEGIQQIVLEGFG